MLLSVHKMDRALAISFSARLHQLLYQISSVHYGMIIKITGEMIVGMTTIIAGMIGEMIMITEETIIRITAELPRVALLSPTAAGCAAMMIIMMARGRLCL